MMEVKRELGKNDKDVRVVSIEMVYLTKKDSTIEGIIAE